MGVSGFVEGLARALAILGGIVLVAITVLTVLSITGRSLMSIGLRPIPGDFELVEVGTGFAVFAFLPWCQLVRGHATVDVFTSFLPDSANRIIDLVSEFLMTGVVVLIAWRLWFGMLDRIRYGETTFILQFPVWWGYAVAMAAAAVAVLVSLYVLFIRIREVTTGKAILGPGQGVIH
jgi:TRAP-type C4-dicarboxylate transport system permease small subunit